MIPQKDLSSTENVIEVREEEVSCETSDQEPSESEKEEHLQQFIRKKISKFKKLTPRIPMNVNDDLGHALVEEPIKFPRKESAVTEDIPTEEGDQVHLIERGSQVETEWLKALATKDTSIAVGKKLTVREPLRTPFPNQVISDDDLQTGSEPMDKDDPQPRKVQRRTPVVAKTKQGQDGGPQLAVLNTSTEEALRVKSDKREGDTQEPKWSTWDLAEQHYGRYSVYLSLSLRDFLLYIVFCAAVTVVALGTLNFTMYLYSFILSDVLTKSDFKDVYNATKTFRSLRTIEQLWTFIFGVYLETIDCRRPEDYAKKIILKTEGDLLLVFENLVIGVPRIRQVRVRPDSCMIPSDFEEIFERCYDYYNAESESRESYGPKSGKQWTFTDDLGSQYNGKVSTYLEGGYYYEFTRDCYKNRKDLLEMKEKKWIDEGTRAVFMDFSVYSPNVNLFCVTKLVAELPPSGGVVTRSHFWTLKLIRYVTVWDYVILGVEGFCVVFLIYFTAQEVRKVVFYKFIYLCFFWNLVDLSILGFGWAVVALSIIRYNTVSEELPAIIETMKSNSHGNLDSLTEIQVTYDVLLGLLVAICWIKILKYLMLCKTIYHILSTVRMVIGELFGLGIILFILLLSFALFGHLLYGSQAQDFGSITSSIMSLALLIIGALDYEEVLNIRPIIGAIYFILFIFLYILVFLSLLIAILVNGFTTMRYEIIEDQNSVFMKELFLKFIHSILSFFRIKKSADLVKNKLEEDRIKQDHILLLEILRRSGYRGKEIRLFLEKHGIKEGEPIPDKKMKTIYEEIDTKGQLYIEAVEHEQIMSQVDLLKTRMNYVDKMTEEMAAKVELLLDKMTNR